jgi:uncharacterized protein YuzE
MKIQYDSSVDVLTIRLKDGKYAESDEVAPNVIIDFDDNRSPLAIEILNARRVLEVETTLKLELPLQGLTD